MKFSPIIISSFFALTTPTLQAAIFAFAQDSGEITLTVSEAVQFTSNTISPGSTLGILIEDAFDNTPFADYTFTSNSTSGTLTLSDDGLSDPSGFFVRTLTTGTGTATFGRVNSVIGDYDSNDLILGFADFVANSLFIDNGTTLTLSAGTYVFDTGLPSVALPELGDHTVYITDNNLDIITSGTTITIGTIPEPSSLALLGLGGLALISRRLR